MWILVSNQHEVPLGMTRMGRHYDPLYVLAVSCMEVKYP